MSASFPPEEGTVYTHERTFTTEDVRRFGELSGDQQAIHTEADEDGRLIVQGLLTATLPTKIGGDLGYLAREMDFTFRKPVYTGDTISCTWTNEAVEERSDRYNVTVSVVCSDEHDETVLDARIEGLVWKDRSASE